MTSRSTERRKRLGLSQVSVDLDESMWAEVFAATGASTKTEAVDRALRSMISARDASRTLRGTEPING